MAKIDDEKYIFESLSTFQKKNDPVEITQLVQNYRKKSEEENNLVFRLAAPLKGGWNRLDQEYGGSFYVDGRYGLSVGVETKEFGPLWIATTSFMEYPAFYEKRGVTGDKAGPRILQIQGLSKEYTYSDHLHRYQAGFEVLKKYRWEFMLIELMKRWTKYEGFNNLYIKPTSQHAWKNADLYAKYRYDIPAKRSGFKYDEPSASWRLRIL